MANADKVLGVGKYRAVRAPRSDLVTLTATGLLPCLNYNALLEMRPERVVPPMWNMTFLIDDVCIRAVKPFSVDVHMSVAADGPTQEITVFDATGEVKVPIEEQIPAAKASFAAPVDQFIVYARLPHPSVKNSGHTGCIVVPADSLVIAVYYNAFGPATQEACDDFVAKNCQPFAGLGLNLTKVTASADGGSEVPWPRSAEWLAARG